MDDAQISSLHVSQNIPQSSPMKVSMSGAENNQIHLSQAVPMDSPLTWSMEGDIESNQVEVSQNAADDNSPLDCSPECPQEEDGYDYPDYQQEWEQSIGGEQDVGQDQYDQDQAD